ncbi:hypothetical protein CCR96_19620 [Halochromatium roseum]|nr:hypothetical protein [Halochromatium roseum]
METEMNQQGLAVAPTFERKVHSAFAKDDASRATAQQAIILRLEAGRDLASLRDEWKAEHGKKGWIEYLNSQRPSGYSRATELIKTYAEFGHYLAENVTPGSNILNSFSVLKAIASASHDGVKQDLKARMEAGETFTKAQVEAEIRKAREDEIEKTRKTRANAKRDREALKRLEQAAAEKDGQVGQYAAEMTQLRESLAEAQAKLEAAETGALAVAPRVVTRADPEMESRLQELERERQQWEQERKEMAHRLDLRDAQLNDQTRKLAEALGTAAKHSSPQLVIEQFINSTWLAGTERDLKAVAEIVRRHPALGDHPGLQYRLRSLADLVDGARGAIEMQDVGMLVDA